MLFRSEREAPQFLFRVAEGRPEGGVGLHYAPRLNVDQADVLRGLFDHRPVEPFALPQGLLCLLALGDILHDADEVSRLTRGIADCRYGQVDPDDGPILAEIPLLHRVSSYLARQ